MNTAHGETTAPRIMYTTGENAGQDTHSAYGGTTDNARRRDPPVNELPHGLVVDGPHRPVHEPPHEPPPHRDHRVDPPLGDGRPHSNAWWRRYLRRKRQPQL